MHRHYLESARLLATPIVLERDEARHLRTVLRLRQGECVELFDGRGLSAVARVVAMGRQTLALRLEGAPARQSPPDCRLTLFVCVSKGKRMDWTLEKAVELGVSRVVPVISARTIVRFDETEAADDKAARWRRVAIEAARQCHAVWLPEIAAPLTLPAAAAQLSASAPVFVAALTPEARPLRVALARWRPPATPPATAGWFVGPEGDFTPEELRLLLEAGAIPVSLGRLILRAETAALWGLCALGVEWL
jgi:16S rRNA (uracil1498-N3)-methyltransferase